MGRIVSLAMFCGCWSPPSCRQDSRPLPRASIRRCRRFWDAARRPSSNDGSVKTLADVVELYDKGGAPNPTLVVFITTLELTDADKRDVVAFMQSLTGTMPAIERPTLPGRHPGGPRG